MKKIKLSGGFHNRGEITINVKSDLAVEDLRNGHTPLYELVTPYQYKRLEKHFCGNKDCKCGHFTRADIEIL